MGILNKVDKAIDLVKSKYLMAVKQKTFKGEKYSVKYLLEKNNQSKDILILFTACTKVGQKARYNYIRTVEEFNCNKLFILDDFGFDNRGAYYLGKDKDFKIEKDVCDLIESICSDLKIDNRIYIGSSKGAYGALYFGLKSKESNVIIGAPQYRLGDYLNLPGHREILRYIMGSTSEDNIEILNELMEKRLEKYKDNNINIFLHYSSKEETYKSDLEPLINKLGRLKYNVDFDKEEYLSHADLTKYFPSYIKKTINKLISN